MLIKNLSFKFNTNNHDYFFQNLTTDFAPNTIHFIQGDNGIGKSTLFTILQGTTNSQCYLTATIVVDGITYTTHNNRLPNALTQQIHTVQQNYNLMIADQFTFLDNLKFANLPTYPTLQALPEATLFECIKLFNIDITQPARLLSGGQRQLLAIMMALQKPTKLLLLDEPTATLDPKNADLIMQCLLQLAKQLHITIIIICHDTKLIQKYPQGTCYAMQRAESNERTLTRA